MIAENVDVIRQKYIANNIKQVIFYHNKDLDGFCSGALIREHLLKFNFSLSEIEMAPIDYRDDIQLFAHSVIKVNDKQYDLLNKNVWIVDFAFDAEIMSRLYSGGVAVWGVNWFDHHKTSIEDSIANGYDKMNGVRKIGKAACGIIFDTLFGNVSYDESIVRPLAKYDVFQKDNDWNQVLEVQFAMRSIKEANPEHEMSITFWRNMLETRISERRHYIFSIGAAILNYRREQDKIECKRARIFHKDGILIAAINQAGLNSESFNPIFEDIKHDCCMVYFIEEDGRYRVSFYGTDAAESKGLSFIPWAKHYGGGGHDRACGCHMTDLGLDNFFYSGSLNGDSGYTEPMSLQEYKNHNEGIAAGSGA